MDTKKLTLIIIFIALATALNIAGPKIPAPYAPGILYYELWEIPIVIAFLAVGPTSGVIIAVINTLILTVTFPGYSPIGPFYNLIAVLPMLLGIYIPYKIATHGCKTENLSSFLQKHVKLISISATASGIALRVIVTTVMNYFALQLPYPFGISDPPKAALLFLPLSVLFNATVALYTIPISIVVTIAVTSRFNLIKNLKI